MTGSPTSLFRGHLVFGVYSLCLAVLSAGVVGELIKISSADETASHLILIPFISLALLFTQRHSVFSSVRHSWFDGIAVLSVALGCLVAGSHYSPWASARGSISLMVAALVIAWVAGFLFAYGRDALRAALFPMLFLCFMIPIPGRMLDAAVLFLRHGSTETTAALFSLTGTPYHRQGFIFSLPNFVIEVADECSGIRSSIALLLSSILAGHVFLATWWKKALLATLILPFAILKNGMRIVTLTLLAEHVDPGYLTGQLHHEGGIVFFLMTLLMMAPLLVVLHKTETAAPQKGNR